MSTPVLTKIIHLDLDAFFASVEQLDNPKLRGKPVVVGGKPDSRGVVAAASYEARKFGIRSAMPCAKAYRLCRETIFVPPRFSRYKEISKQVHEILREVTDIIEPLSLDEAYLDVTVNKLNEPSAQKIAIYLRERIQTTIGITASAGVAPVKFVAKIASDLHKPDGLTVIPPAAIDEFVRRLPVEKLWSVGPATAKKLHSKGLKTADDIRKLDRRDLGSMLGKHGLFLYDLASGIDHRRVNPDREPKSRGTEETFATDILDVETLCRVLEEQSRNVAESLKRLGRFARTVTIKVRYQNFETITRSRSLSDLTNNSDRLATVAQELLKTATQAGNNPIRLLGLSVSGLEEHRQILDQLELPLY